MSRVNRLIRPTNQKMKLNVAAIAIGVCTSFLGLPAIAAFNDTYTSSQAPIPSTIATTQTQAENVMIPPDKAKAPVVVAGRIDFQNPGCKIEYPREALKARLTGETFLTVIINPDGNIGEVTILKSSGHEILDNAVKDKLRSGSCQTAPGTVDGVPKPTQTKIRYVWKLEPDKKIDESKKTQF